MFKCIWTLKWPQSVVLSVQNSPYLKLFRKKAMYLIIFFVSIKATTAAFLRWIKMMKKPLEMVKILLKYQLKTDSA